jgi:two-component system nitrogen regulation sensor histidine kinase NtrY
MSSDEARRSPRLTHERRVFVLALTAGLPGVAIALTLLVTHDYPARVTWTLGTLVLGCWLGVSMYLRERVVRPLQTLSNMLAALREGDFSLRARQSKSEDALGLALLEVNMLAETLRSQRLGAMEATALLRAVMAEIDVAIFAFDAHNEVRLANRAAERLLALPVERLIGRSAAAAGLADFLQGDTPRVHDRSFPGSSGRWEVRRTTFRQDGLPHTLLVVSDISKTLREEELIAWQRLVRVLSHEINNSLAPIKSIAGTLTSVLDRSPRPPDADTDLRSGLSIIGARSEALSRFMSSYALLARLPSPRPQEVDVGVWVRRTTGLETRLRVEVDEGPPTVIQADGDQLDQLLINLVRNAADAALETGGGVIVTWSRENGELDLEIADEGPGLTATTNLFVPFFTTKPSGSGIGLVLCRQIAEAHGGVLTLENRRGAHGCIARLSIPVAFRGRGGSA